MISPHTPPGTKIVCIDVGSVIGRLAINGFIFKDIDHGLALGQVYTVREIIPSYVSRDGFEILLDEIHRGTRPRTGIEAGYSLARFRPAELPKCLTELLNTAPVRNNKRVGVE